MALSTDEKDDPKPHANSRFADERQVLTFLVADHEVHEPHEHCDHLRLRQTCGRTELCSLPFDESAIFQGRRVAVGDALDDSKNVETARR
jgi:hypothetical protein